MSAARPFESQKLVESGTLRLRNDFSQRIGIPNGHTPLGGGGLREMPADEATSGPRFHSNGDSQSFRLFERGDICREWIRQPERGYADRIISEAP